MAVGGESIVKGLDVCGVEPDRGTDAGPDNRKPLLAGVFWWCPRGDLNPHAR